MLTILLCCTSSRGQLDPGPSGRWAFPYKKLSDLTSDEIKAFEERVEMIEDQGVLALTDGTERIMSKTAGDHP
jgi:hypothetical protein